MAQPKPRSIKSDLLGTDMHFELSLTAPALEVCLMHILLKYWLKYLNKYSKMLYNLKLLNKSCYQNYEKPYLFLQAEHKKCRQMENE